MSSNGAYVSRLKGAIVMLAWTIHSYGGLNELKLEERPIPRITSANDVLVEVKASSVNPIDSLMIGGYARTTLQIVRGFQNEFPLILGRDLSGIVIDKGHNVHEFNIGDEVYGVVNTEKPGSFAEALLVDKNNVVPKPKNLTHEESTSLAFSSMTAWSALYIFGGLGKGNTHNFKVLVTGASGGVGTAAVQLLKSQGCKVFATVSPDAVPLLNSLGTDVVFNRKDPDFERNVAKYGKYNIILDLANIGFRKLPKSWMYDTYISLDWPLLRNIDDYGLFTGLLRSSNTFIQDNAEALKHSSTVKWGFFVPSKPALEFVNDLITSSHIRPVIQEEFRFQDLPHAIEVYRRGHARGKIVVSYS